MSGNARSPKLPGSGLFISEYVEQVIFFLDTRQG